MKFLLSIIFLAIGCISLSESACSAERWEPVPFLDPSRILGRWFALKRYANGQHGNARCLWHDIFKHPTRSDVAVETSNRVFYDRKSSHTQGDLTYVNPTKQDGEINVAMQNGNNVKKFIVAIDYDEYAILRTCHKDIEYFWVYMRSVNPSNETMERVNKIVDEQKPDYSKMVASCVGSHPSDFVLIL